MNIVLGCILIAIWIYVLTVLTRASLGFWRYLWGSMGTFVIAIVSLRGILEMPLARLVATMAGVIGELTGTFDTYLKYGILFITTGEGSMTLQINFECSGMIEILVFVSLLIFFQVYTLHERIIMSVLGTAYIMLCNVLRVVVICEVVHFFGADAYNMAHTFLGRILFYGLTVLLYFYVFTKPQIFRMKVGNFSYDSKQNS